MSEHGPAPIRTTGPPVVWEGDNAAPTVLVLDPAGAAKHDELPATWREFAQSRQIVWCRLPTDGSLADADEALTNQSGTDQAVDVVASGPVAETALELVERHTHTVRALLLIDPAAHHHLDTDQAAAADAGWEQETSDRRGRLAEAGVTVQVVAHSHGGNQDQVSPPLPLGHPEAVAAIERAVTALDR